MCVRPPQYTRTQRMSALDVVTVVFGLIGGLSVTTKAVCEVIVGQLWDVMCKVKPRAAGQPAIQIAPAMVVATDGARPVPIGHPAGAQPV